MRHHYHQFAWCHGCGTYGHLERDCPARRVQEMQDPFHNRKPPAVSHEPSNPADRDANQHTLFLGKGQAR